MNPGSTDDEHLWAIARAVPGPRLALIEAKIIQFNETKRLNKATEAVIYQQIAADIAAAKAESLK
jgi:hypothetical protein